MLRTEGFFKINSCFDSGVIGVLAIFGRDYGVGVNAVLLHTIHIRGLPSVALSCAGMSSQYLRLYQTITWSDA